eukprot:CAMPEP_0197032472 /NCGR_PEP_ID=MMETSP1384-20130603/11141_1 /TAXON_ID=29189 /ORGANISM="Ammonia sp." /LENGTH=213 /DNA_ID=CAMNT_0042462137 /DNA_START=233 /DNA_END=871 /DNA_ORIENTATION=+
MNAYKALLQALLFYKGTLQMVNGKIFFNELTEGDKCKWHFECVFPTECVNGACAFAVSDECKKNTEASMEHFSKVHRKNMEEENAWMYGGAGSEKWENKKKFYEKAATEATYSLYTPPEKCVEFLPEGTTNCDAKNCCSGFCVTEPDEKNLDQTDASCRKAAIGCACNPDLEWCEYGSECGAAKKCVANELNEGDKCKWDVECVYPLECVNGA